MSNFLIKPIKGAGLGDHVPLNNIILLKICKCKIFKGWLH